MAYKKEGRKGVALFTVMLLVFFTVAVFTIMLNLRRNNMKISRVQEANIQTYYGMLSGLEVGLSALYYDDRMVGGIPIDLDGDGKVEEVEHTMLKKFEEGGKTTLKGEVFKYMPISLDNGVVVNISIEPVLIENIVWALVKSEAKMDREFVESQVTFGSAKVSTLIPYKVEWELEKK